MAPSNPAGEPSSSRADDDDDHGRRAAADEETPLLSTDLPPDVAPDNSFQGLVVTMCILFLFIVEVSQFIMEAPMQQLMEDIICRDRYPDHQLGLMGKAAKDPRCKNNDVQKELVMVRSWASSAEMFVPLLVQIPYGIIADKYGRRSVLFSGLFGAVLQTGWVLIVLWSPDVFNIWAMLYGNIAFLIGGGAPTILAMIWTILADAVPVARRTSVFYLFHAMTLLLSVLITPISGTLLSINPWIAMWLGFGFLVTGTFASLLVPETLKLRQRADSEQRRRGSISHDAETQTALPAVTRRNRFHQAWFTVKNDMGHIWQFVFSSRNILMLMLAMGFSAPIKMNFSQNLLQYMTKRFGWEWSTATYVSTVSSITSVVVLLLVLPGASSILVKRFGFNPINRDLLLARASMGFLIVGSFLVSLAGVPWLFIPALVVVSVGNGITTLCRALLNAIVEPHTVAIMNTTVSMVETIINLASAPFMGWLLGKGMDLGGLWAGLPHFVSGCFAIITFLALVGFKVPKAFAQG